MLLALFAGAWLLPDQSPMLDLRLLPPGLAHPLGTDHLSRDLWLRVLAGGLPTTEALAAALVVAGLFGLPAAGKAGLLTAELAGRALTKPHARAAVALGATLPHVLARHVLPAVRGALLGWAAARMPRLGLSYAGLVFLGLGADLGRADWGVMVWEYRGHALDAPWLMAGPALGMAALSLSLRAGLRALAR